MSEKIAGFHPVGEELHVDVAEVLAHLGLPDTPAGRDFVVREVLAEAARRRIPTTLTTEPFVPPEARG